MLAGLLLLSFSVFAQAALSPNLLSNPDFKTAGLTNIPSGDLASGVWYGSSSDWIGEQEFWNSNWFDYRSCRFNCFLDVDFMTFTATADYAWYAFDIYCALG